MNGAIAHRVDTIWIDVAEPRVRYLDTHITGYGLTDREFVFRRPTRLTVTQIIQRIGAHRIASIGGPYRDHPTVRIALKKCDPLD